MSEIKKDLIKLEEGKDDHEDIQYLLNEYF